MVDVSKTLYKSKMLDYYFDRQAESSIGHGSRFEISKAVFGISSLVTKNSSGTYDIDDIPSDFKLEDLLSSFCITPPTLSYNNGIILLRADLDTTQLDKNTAYPFNTLVILDNEGKACAVMCVQEDSLYVGKGYVGLLQFDVSGSSSDE